MVKKILQNRINKIVEKSFFKTKNIIFDNQDKSNNFELESKLIYNIQKEVELNGEKFYIK